MKDVFIEPVAKFVAAEIAPIRKLGTEFSRAKDAYETSLAKYMAKKDESGSSKIEKAAAEVAECKKK